MIPRCFAVSDDEMPPIPGVAGVDFPVLTEIPQTGFDCAAQDFPGIYADMDTDCQVSTELRKIPCAWLREVCSLTEVR